MIAESKSYLGVPCLRCGERIVVSAKVVSIQAEIENGELNAPHAFVARCRMCEYESVYQIKDVQTFDGEPSRPRRRMVRARAA
jgi:hypothetical protein